MPDFYFTYGTSKVFPFRGGWTRVTAPSINVALSAFVAVHPNVNGHLNCAFYLTEDKFNETLMPKNGVCGAFEHEHISAMDILNIHQKKKTADSTANTANGTNKTS